MSLDFAQTTFRSTISIPTRVGVTHCLMLIKKVTSATWFFAEALFLKSKESKSVLVLVSFVAYRKAPIIR
jgi:hypothetical protein